MIGLHSSKITDVGRWTEYLDQLAFVVFEISLHDVHARAKKSFEGCHVQNYGEEYKSLYSWIVNWILSRLFCWVCESLFCVPVLSSLTLKSNKMWRKNEWEKKILSFVFLLTYSINFYALCDEYEFEWQVGANMKSESSYNNTFVLHVEITLTDFSWSFSPLFKGFSRILIINGYVESEKERWSLWFLKDFHVHVQVDVICSFSNA